MATIGHIQEFDPEKEKVSAYLERVQMFLVANSIEADKKVPVLLSVIGGKTYALLGSLLAPEKPKDKTFEQLSDVLQKHFEPKPVVIVQRFHFHRRNQALGETVAEYVAELRRLATHCKFEGYLEEALRDRLVCGLKNEGVQKRLLTYSDLTLVKAIEVAQSMEAAERDTQEMKSTELAVRKVITPRSAVQTKPCYRCGKEGHEPHSCGFRETICHHCKKRGHLARVCRSKAPNVTGASGKASWRPKKGKRGPVKWLGVSMEKEAQPTEETEERVILRLGGPPSKPITVEVEINGQSLLMEVDTGSAVSLISQDTQQKCFPQVKLNSTAVVLQTYTAEAMAVLGVMMVQVKYGEYVNMHELYVVEGKGPSLLGRAWLETMRLDWQSLKVDSVSECSPTSLKAVLQEYSDVFSSELGTMKEFQAKLTVREETKPRFCRPRPVPYALKGAVEKELDRLEESGVVERVSHSDWAAPIVPVPKPDGTVRICGDYKVTVNSALDVDQYPLPRPADLMASLTGGQKFSKIDLTSAYQQMILEEESRQYVTINTHRGLYRFTRLPFGIASAPAIFQKAMDSVLQGVANTICYIDDILVTGRSDQEHLKNLGEALSRLRQYGLRIKQNKCAFMQNVVEYLGHRVDAQGVHAAPSKVEAILQAPTPRNVTELRSFLGMINYYGKFIPNLSSINHPLNNLLRAGQKWKWTKQCEKAFQEAKEKLSTAEVLAHYDPRVPIRLAGDASSYGIGAVLSHVFADGTERPVAYASRTLLPNEQNYAQVEKEALSLIFGVQKFHQYIYGREFTLVTDHRPLTTIFGPKKGVPSLAAARLQRWALLLSAYRYNIEFKPTLAHANADGLSRLPLKHQVATGNPPDPAVFNVQQLNVLPVTARQLAAATCTDPVLGRVLRYTRAGWPPEVGEELKPFSNRRKELSVEEGCILWGIRVVVPSKLRKQVLSELHQGHTGVVRMKSLARSHIWWPGLDQEVEEMVKACTACQEVKNSPTVAPLHPWIWPDTPWARIHVDFAGPYRGKTYLIIVDAHSKWPEVIEMKSTTTASLIVELRRVFSVFGLPQQVVSDNGPQFISAEFERFMKENGVKHVRSAPYHPSTNGLAERFVQSFKQALKTGERRGVPSQQCLAEFLLAYRVTPHSTTNESPSKLLMGRQLRTRLDLLHPDCGSTVMEHQNQQKQHHDRKSRPRDFHVGQNVMVRNFREGPRWVQAVVVERCGPVSYLVQTLNGNVWKRHVDHVKIDSDDSAAEVAKEKEDASPEIFPEETEQTSAPSTASTGNTGQSSVLPPTSQTVRRSSRQRRPPDRLTF